MIETIMICDCCGTKFYSKYYTGGYIDHFDNFARQREIIVSRGVEEIVREIVFNGNKPRWSYDARKRLNCFLQWDCVDKNIKSQAAEAAETFINKIEKAILRADEIEKWIENNESPLVIALLKKEELDDCYWELLEECCEGENGLQKE